MTVRATVRVDGDLSGAVVIGDASRAVVSQAAPLDDGRKAAAQAGDAAAGGAVFQVQGGNMHIHRFPSSRAALLAATAAISVIAGILAYIL